MNGQINCPNCGSVIVFDQQELLQGRLFRCGGCGASLGIAQESVSTVSSALAKLDGVRRQVAAARARSG